MTRVYKRSDNDQTLLHVCIRSLNVVFTFLDEEFSHIPIFTEILVLRMGSFQVGSNMAVFHWQNFLHFMQMYNIYRKYFGTCADFHIYESVICHVLWIKCVHLCRVGNSNKIGGGGRQGVLSYITTREVFFYKKILGHFIHKVLFRWCVVWQVTKYLVLNMMTCKKQGMTAES